MASKSVTVFPFGSRGSVGDEAATLDAGQLYSVAYDSATAPQFRFVEMDFEADAGSYTLTLVTQKDPAAGICTVSVDGVVQGTIDLYAVAPAKNFVGTVAVVLPRKETSDYILSFSYPTKNGASAGFTGVWSAAFLTRV